MKTTTRIGTVRNMDATEQNEQDRRVGRIVRLAGEAGIELPRPLSPERQAEHDRSLAAYDRALGEGRN
jgi:hypothetical protein